MTNIRKTLTALTVFGTATLGAAGLASAQEVTTTTTAAPLPAAAVAAPSTTTLPLFGASLIIDITVGPDGGLDAVNINNSTDPSAAASATGTPAVWTADKVKPNKVSFINDAGTVRVVVKANDGGQRVAVKAATLAAISGNGEWKGDVFEDGFQSSVKYTVGGTPDAPTVAIGDISVTAPIMATAIPAKVSTDDEQVSARAGVTFTNGTSTRTLTIAVEVHQAVETDDDSSHEGAQLRVTLGRIHTQALVGAGVVGSHTWNGTLCDNTKVSVTYDVAADGTVTVAKADGQSVETKNNGARVTFTDGSKLSIKVEGSDDNNGDDQMRLREQFRIRCERENPVLNVPTSTTDGRDTNEDDDHSEDRKGREEHSSDKSSSTTSTTRSGDRPTTTTVRDGGRDGSTSGKGSDD